MSDYQEELKQQIDDTDYGYEKIAYCTTCKTPEFLIYTAGYYYCTKCTNDEVTFINPVPEWVRKEVIAQNQIKI